MVSTFFAVVPDGRAVPSALFVEIEDAIVWGLERYGSEGFGIRACCIRDGDVASSGHGDRTRPAPVAGPGQRGGGDS